MNFEFILKQTLFNTINKLFLILQNCLFFSLVGPAVDDQEFQPVAEADSFAFNVSGQAENCNRVVDTHCKFCRLYFKMELDLKLHLREAHGKYVLLICKECSQCFYSHNGFRDHMSIVHRVNSGSQCPICQKRFSCRSRMMPHLKAHSENRYFACPLCGKSYKHKKDLKKHNCTIGSINV